MSTRSNSSSNTKELDAQIKENNNLIRKLEEKVASISEDMNDLIGLYEIVSGQMNPFVGLSKVTKKRLDVLENFDKEMESLKTRLDSIEYFKFLYPGDVGKHL